MIEKESAIESYNMDERLKDIFQRLMELYERQAQERQLMAKEKEETIRLINLLISQTKEIGQYENGIRKRIQDCIKISAEEGIKNIEEVIVEKNNQIIDKCVKKVEQNYEAIESIITHFRAEKYWQAWKIMGVAIFSGILTGILSVFLFMPK